MISPLHSLRHAHEAGGVSLHCEGDGRPDGIACGAEVVSVDAPGAVGARFRRILLHRCFAHRLLRAPRPPRREDVGDCTRQTARVNAIMNTGRGA